jgi:hypothetical protein
LGNPEITTNGFISLMFFRIGSASPPNYPRLTRFQAAQHEFLEKFGSYIMFMQKEKKKKKKKERKDVAYN